MFFLGLKTMVIFLCPTNRTLLFGKIIMSMLQADRETTEFQL